MCDTQQPSTTSKTNSGSSVGTATTANRLGKVIESIVVGCGTVPWQFEGVDDAVDTFLDDLVGDLKDEKADIYQVTSVLRCPRYQHLPHADACPWWQSYRIWKCLLCAFLQMLVTPLVAINQAYSIYSSETFVSIMSP